MPVSTVRFHSLNADPIPSPSVLATLGLSSGVTAYGAVVGGDSALDTKDTTGSYIIVGQLGSGHGLVTCRPVISPPIPAGALVRPSFPTDIMVDFEATLMQVAFQFAPTMPPVPPGGSLAPTFRIARASDGHEVAVNIAEGRDATNTAWSINWWDETNSGTHDGPPAWTSTTALTQPGMIAFLAPSDYLVIYTADPESLLISQFVGQITWEPNGPFWHHVGGHSGNPTGGPNLQIYTPGVGWVEMQDGFG